MRILVDESNVVVAAGPICQLYNWEDEPEISKWKVDEDFYIIDQGFTAYNVESIPDDFYPRKYLYMGGKFAENGEWSAPPLPPERKLLLFGKELAHAQADLVKQREGNSILEEQLTLTQEALVEQYESNLLLEETMLDTQEALVEQYETNLLLEEEMLNTQEALVEQYEINLALEEQLSATQDELINTQVALTEIYEQLLALQNV